MFVAISLSLAATTIKSLQYNYHIATPLVCVAISKLPVDAKINTLESEGKCSPSTESEPSVLVNLTC